jgi:hypothetical protein
MKTTLLRSLLALAVTAVFAVPARAGGPLANCTSGTPYRWAAGGATIPWNPDQGELGALTNAQAVSAVGSAFAVWDAVPTSTVGYLQGAPLPVDVDETNYGPYFDAPAPDGLSAIVFDDSGIIFEELFGPNSGILGFAGPEWGIPATCTITEGYAFLNGPAFSNATYAMDVMVHEFGHYTNLAHTAVNGQIFLAGDDTGPTPFDTFGPAPALTTIETMYPFYFGTASGTQTLQREDVASVSKIYPGPTFLATTATIAGAIKSSDAVTRLSGVNVIARNVADPFLDAVASLSGDATPSTSQADPLTGTYRFEGLTPGAQYAVYVDQILDGGFSTPPILLPNYEEFHSGATESANPATDPPNTYAAVSAPMGGTASNVDVVFNTFQPGDALPLGDDGFIRLAIGFPFKVCGQEFTDVFVNANGSLTFGSGSSDFSESVPEHLGGAPRIAGLWDDLDSSDGGVITFDRTANTFTAIWDSVPEFSSGGANSFSITLKRSANQATIDYGALTALDGLTGLSCGAAVASGFENEQNLRTHGSRRTINMNGETAAFEIFTGADDVNDTDSYEVLFTNLKQGFADVFEPNNSVAAATRIRPPFSTQGTGHYSAIAPAGADVDFYRFSARAGEFIAIETVRSGLDTVIGVFDAVTGAPLVADDDGGAGLNSRLLLQANVDLDLAVGVSTFPDVTFTGAGSGSGRYVLSINTYRGSVLPAGDDTATPLPLGFTFRYQGQNWTSAFVNSNGSVTFGAGDTDFSSSVPELLARAPRIAPLWTDLDARFGLVIAEPGTLKASVHYVSVPEFFSDSPNYFSVHLLPLGIFALDYGATARGGALVGITQGNGAADPGESDLSDGLPLFSGRGTRYEEFIPPDPGDLSFEPFLFLPF